MLHTRDDKTQHTKIPYYCKIREKALRKRCTQMIELTQTFLVADCYMNYNWGGKKSVCMSVCV